MLAIKDRAEKSAHELLRTEDQYPSVLALRYSPGKR